MMMMLSLIIKTVFSPQCTKDNTIHLRDRFRESPQQLISKIKQSAISQFYIDLCVLNGHDGKKLYDVLSVEANGLNPETMKFFDWIIALCNTRAEARGGYELSLQNQETFAIAGVDGSSVPTVLAFDIMMDGIPEEQQAVANTRDDCRVQRNSRHCAIGNAGEGERRAGACHTFSKLCFVFDIEFNVYNIGGNGIEMFFKKLLKLGTEYCHIVYGGGYHKSLLTYHHNFCGSFEEQYTNNYKQAT